MQKHCFQARISAGTFNLKVHGDGIVLVCRIKFAEFIASHYRLLENIDYLCCQFSNFIVVIHCVAGRKRLRGAT